VAGRSANGWNISGGGAYTEASSLTPPMAAPRSGSLFGRLLLLFTIVPVVELVLLVWMGGRVGFWPTVGLIVVTAFAGAWLAKREGLSVWARFQRRLASGGLPGRELTDGLIILVSGALLLTPGVLTDVVGMLGLLPPSRAAIRAYLSGRMQRAVAGGTAQVMTFGMPFGAGSADAFGSGSFGRDPLSTEPPPVDPRPEVQDVRFEEFEGDRWRSGRAE